MTELFRWVHTTIATSLGVSDRGAIGALVIGIIIGVLLVIFGIVKLLIPGD